VNVDVTLIEVRWFDAIPKQTGTQKTACGLHGFLHYIAQLAGVCYVTFAWHYNGFV
jgi:hypothetical protein